MYHAQMRKTLVMLINDNMEKYQPIYIGRNWLHDHVSSMSKDSIWGMQVEIQAAADYLGLHVYELMYDDSF